MFFCIVVYVGVEKGLETGRMCIIVKLNVLRSKTFLQQQK